MRDGVAAALGRDPVTKRVSRQELCNAVITVHGGGSVIAPRLADHLLRQYRKASRGETERLHNQLSTRELEILRLVAQGDTDRWIAEWRSTSPRARCRTTSSGSGTRPACGGAPS